VDTRRGQRADPCQPTIVFHVELRHFPNTARAFNLSGEDLQRRFLGLWVAGRSIELDDRRWSPEQARLTIYEGPSLRPDQIGMGRGWANVTRSGEDVSARVIEEAQKALQSPSSEVLVSELKAAVLARAAGGRLSAPQLLALAHERHPGWRASDRLAIAELAVWELLHQNRVRILRGEQPVEQEQWGSILLEWETWAPEAGTPLLFLEPAG
jgi:hypothetical protein